MTTEAVDTRINIVDVINHYHCTQAMIVVDRQPAPIFERRGQLLIGHDSGFYKFYGYETPGPTWEAFGGREFDIPMADGTIIKANGQWWDPGIPKDYRDLLYSPGVNTIERLAQCHVFSGCLHVDRELLDAWLAANEPSNNYHKYDVRHADYGKHTITSPWA